MENILIVVILACIIGCIIFYLFKAKKSGAACIGCPASGKCTGKCSACSDEKKKNE